MRLLYFSYCPLIIIECPPVGRRPHVGNHCFRGLLYLKSYWFILTGKLIKIRTEYWEVRWVYIVHSSIHNHCYGLEIPVHIYLFFSQYFRIILISSRAPIYGHYYEFHSLRNKRAFFYMYFQKFNYDSFESVLKLLIISWSWPNWLIMKHFLLIRSRDNS